MSTANPISDNNVMADDEGDDEEVQLQAEGLEPPLSRIVRYLGSLVAWSRAVAYMLGASRRLKPQDLVFNLVEMHSPHPIPTHKLPLKRLLHRALNIPYEPSSNAEFQAQLHLLCQRLSLEPAELLSPTNFTVTIHCEAALMGMINSDEIARKVSKLCLHCWRLFLIPSMFRA